MDVEQMHARRILSRTAAAAAAAVASPGPGGQVDGSGGAPRSAPFSSLDAMVITILSLLLCALVVALVLHALVRCAFRVTRRVCYGQEPPGAEASGERAALAGASRKGKASAIGAFPTVVYSAEIELAVCGSTECAICLAEFAQGERVLVLPRCNHCFHVQCIDLWLSARQTCPTCRRVPFCEALSTADTSGGGGDSAGCSTAAGVC